MKANPLENKDSAKTVVVQNIDSKNILFTDQLTGHLNSKNRADAHVSFKLAWEGINELKWVHIAIFNTKRTLVGSYLVIKEKYLHQSCCIAM